MKRKLRKAAGHVLFSVPFVALLVWMVSDIGWIASLQTFGVAVAVVSSFAIAMWLVYG